VLPTVDLAIIALYFAASLGVGYWASRRIKSASDYSIAGGHLRFPVLLGTLIATAIGASSTMGRAGKAYEVGIGIFFASIAYAAGLYLFSYLAPVLKRANIWSVPHALRLRYGKPFMFLASFIILLAVVGIFGVQLIAFGVIVVTLLPGSGIDYAQAVLAGATIMVVYTALGGLLAVAYTDVLQTVIMLLSIGIMLPALIAADLGGVATAIDSLAPQSGNWLGGMTVAYFVAIVLVDVPFSLMDNSLWLRTGASRSVRDIQRGVRLTACSFVVWSLVVSALGVFAAQLLPGLQDTPAGADGAIPRLVIEYMPPIVRGFCLAALLAIIMSTADTVLLICGTTVAWDIAGGLKPQISDDKRIRIARLTVLAVGVIGAIFALTVRGLFDVLLIAFAVYVSTLFMPMMAALFWRRATRAGATGSALAAFVTLVALYALKFVGTLPTNIEPIIVSMTVSLVVMVGISLVTWRPTDATTPVSRMAPRGAEVRSGERLASSQ
jgi:SSS family transporter